MRSCNGIRAPWSLRRASVRRCGNSGLSTGRSVRPRPTPPVLPAGFAAVARGGNPRKPSLRTMLRRSCRALRPQRFPRPLSLSNGTSVCCSDEQIYGIAGKYQTAGYPRSASAASGDAPCPSRRRCGPPLAGRFRSGSGRFGRTVVRALSRVPDLLPCGPKLCREDPFGSLLPERRGGGGFPAGHPCSGSWPNGPNDRAGYRNVAVRRGMAIRLPRGRSSATVRVRGCGPDLRGRVSRPGSRGS